MIPTFKLRTAFTPCVVSGEENDRRKERLVDIHEHNQGRDWNSHVFKKWCSIWSRVEVWLCDKRNSVAEGCQNYLSGRLWEIRFKWSVCKKSRSNNSWSDNFVDAMVVFRKYKMENGYCSALVRQMTSKEHEQGVIDRTRNRQMWRRQDKHGITCAHLLKTCSIDCLTFAPSNSLSVKKTLCLFNFEKRTTDDWALTWEWSWDENGLESFFSFPPFGLQQTRNTFGLKSRGKIIFTRFHFNANVCLTQKGRTKLFFDELEKRRWHFGMRTIPRWCETRTFVKFFPNRKDKQVLTIKLVFDL